MDHVFMKGMPFFGRHGVFTQERELGQRFIVSLELSLDLAPAGRADDLELTVNYADVYTKVRAIVEGPPYSLLEAVAERIAETLLADYAQVQSVRVELDKPGAPIAGLFATVGVAIMRVRST